MFAHHPLRAPLIRLLTCIRQMAHLRWLPHLPMRMFAVVFFISGCDPSIPKPVSETVTRASTPRILAMGDSMLAWHRSSNRAISDELERQLGVAVIDRSITAARFNYALPITGALGLNISKQFRNEKWDWVVLNGGGNDLWFGCGCVVCDGTLNKLVSPDASAGKIPDLVSRIRAGGARVVFIGYLYSPGSYSIIDHCKDEAIELENRLARLASQQNGFYFLRVSNLVPDGDRSFHSVDMIHPSIKASKMIGELVAGIINANSL